MPQRDFLLVVDPVLIVGPKTGVDNPLPEAQIAFGEIVRNRLSFRRPRVPGEVWDAGDDAAAPVIDDRLGLIGEHCASQLQVVLVLRLKSAADFQFVELLHGDRRPTDLGLSV